MELFGTKSCGIIYGSQIAKSVQNELYCLNWGSNVRRKAIDLRDLCGFFVINKKKDEKSVDGNRLDYRLWDSCGW